MLRIIPLNRINEFKNLKTLAIVEDANNHPQGILKLTTEEDVKGELLIDLPDGMSFVPSPTKEERQRDVVLISGASGCGKSVLASKMAKHFINAYCSGDEENRVFIISSDDIDDPAYNFKHRHIKLDDSLITQPLELDELTNKEGKRNLLIMDDIEGVSNPKLKKAVDAMTQRILEVGRKRQISTFFIVHRPANGNATKQALVEMDSFVFFPKFITSSRNIDYTLTHHLGIPEGMRKVLKTEGWGRWVMIKLKAPQMIISEKRACMFDSDDCATALKNRNSLQKRVGQREIQQLLGVAPL